MCEHKHVDIHFMRRIYCHIGIIIMETLSKKSRRIKQAFAMQGKHARSQVVIHNHEIKYHAIYQ